MDADRVVGELAVVAAPQEEAVGALALAGRVVDVVEATAQELERGVELGAGSAGGERGLDPLRRDAVGEQPAADPVGAPAVQAAAILGEAQRVARVVEVLVGEQAVDRALRQLALDPARREVTADLRDGAIAPAEVRERQRGRRGRFGRLAQAAFSSTSGTAATGGASDPVGAAASRSIPRAS
jgi:hypothetical protein